MVVKRLSLSGLVIKWLRETMFTTRLPASGAASLEARRTQRRLTAKTAIFILGIALEMDGNPKTASRAWGGQEGGDKRFQVLEI